MFSGNLFDKWKESLSVDLDKFSKEVKRTASRSFGLIISRFSPLIFLSNICLIFLLHYLVPVKYIPEFYYNFVGTFRKMFPIYSWAWIAFAVTFFIVISLYWGYISYVAIKLSEKNSSKNFTGYLGGIAWFYTLLFLCFIFTFPFTLLFSILFRKFSFFIFIFPTLSVFWFLDSRRGFKALFKSISFGLKANLYYLPGIVLLNIASIAIGLVCFIFFLLILGLVFCLFFILYSKLSIFLGLVLNEQLILILLLAFIFMCLFSIMSTYIGILFLSLSRVYYKQVICKKESAVENEELSEVKIENKKCNDKL